MSDKLEAIKRRIAALANMTVDNGASEEEARSAAQKVMELLSDYNLNMDDVEVREATTKKMGFYTGYQIQLPISICFASIALLTDTHVWFVKDDDGVVIYNYFGLEHDVMMAKYLSTIVHRALHTESAKYKESEHYLGMHTSARRSAYKGFQQGFGVRMNDRLKALIESKKAEEYARTHHEKSSATALILHDKRERIEDEMEKKFGFRPKYSKKKMKVRAREAYGHGQIAANGVALNKPLEEEKANRRLIGA